MKIIGSDFHSRYQRIALLDRETGELEEWVLQHENGEARSFYEGLKEPALVGIESTSYTLWFEEMLSELGHELVVGDAAKIRAMAVRKQKYDRQDALHLMTRCWHGATFRASGDRARKIVISGCYWSTGIT
jgi:transposase